MSQNKTITKIKTNAEIAELVAAYCMPENELIELLGALLAAHLDNKIITEYFVTLEDKYEKK